MRADGIGTIRRQSGLPEPRHAVPQLSDPSRHFLAIPSIPQWIRESVEGEHMTRFSADQLAYAAARKGYMGRQESIEFLKQMDIKHSVGHWSAGDFCDRFAPPGYHSDQPGFGSDFESQCRRTKAAGI